jgi:NADH-quinone oxidoreductase subunit N
LLKAAVPETILVVFALIALAADLLTMRDLDYQFRRIITGLIASVGCVAAIAWMLVMPEHANFFDGMLVLDPLTQLVKVALLVITIFTILVSVESDFTAHIGEYFALILLAAIGMLFLVSSEDILMIFISLELTSLSLYILTAFNKRNVKSAEAALKYFLFGGMSAAFTLFGLSLLYGLSGATNLSQIAATLQKTGLDPLLIVAIVMTVIGFGFKIAAVPFHLWAPDAYEGAPAPSAAFIASGSKVASFFVFAKVLMIGFHGAEGSGAWRAFIPGWVPVIAVIAVASMLLGNLAAIVQSSVRRLLAYSAIAHAGYILLGILANGRDGLASVVFYVVIYGLTTVGAFGVVSIVQDRTGGDTLANFIGLSKRAPILSFCMMVFMLSLAGIPPLAGFFGKFYLFAAALKSTPDNLGFLWLILAAIALSAVSLYYYLIVLKQIYVVAPSGEDAPLKTPILSQVILSLLALAVLILGCAPNLLLGRLTNAIQVAGF